MDKDEMEKNIESVLLELMKTANNLIPDLKSGRFYVCTNAHPIEFGIQFKIDKEQPDD